MTTPPATIIEVFAEMRDRAMGRFAEYGLEGATRLDFVAEMRFVGQAFEVPVALDPAGLESLTAKELKRLFGEAHHRIYFHGAAAEKAIEAVSFRLGVTAPLADVPRLREVPADGSPAADIEIFDGRHRQAGRVMARASLAGGTRTLGPALLEDETSTILVPAGWMAAVDGQDNLIIRRED